MCLHICCLGNTGEFTSWPAAPIVTSFYNTTLGGSAIPQYVGVQALPEQSSTVPETHWACGHAGCKACQCRQWAVESSVHVNPEAGERSCKSRHQSIALLGSSNLTGFQATVSTTWSCQLEAKHQVKEQLNFRRPFLGPGR